MPYRIERDQDFVADLQRWAEADRSLGEELVSRIEEIEDRSFKGEWKPGGPIRGSRGEPVRNRTYTIVYELRPRDPISNAPEEVEVVYFKAITKHDDQADAATSVGSPIDPLYGFEVEVPAAESGRIRAGLHDVEGVEIDRESWGGDGGVTLRGHYERTVRSTFRRLVDDDWVVLEERRSIAEFLPEP